MKKSLSLLVAIAMVFSMFATVVSAAEEPTAGEYLNELGVILGNQDGDLKEDQTWKRQDMIVLLSRLFGAEDEAKGADKTHEFKDVTDKNYDGYISWAVEEGLTKGKSATVFGFGDELETRDFYAFILRALGQDVDYEEVDAVAVELGLAPEDTDFDAIPLRGETYVAIVAALKTEVGENGETLEELLGLVEVVVPAIAAVASGAKKIEVKFNKAVDDTKAAFTVKKGAVTLNVSAKSFSEDKKVATLELSSKISEGEYTVSVTGVQEEALTSSFTAENEKVAKVEFLSENAPLVDGDGDNNVDDLSIPYQVLNQYGENITKFTTLSNNIGALNPTNGTIAINGDYRINDVVAVTLVHAETATSVVKTFTVVAEARVAEVAITGLYNKDGKTLDEDTNLTNVPFYLLVEAKDQYGNVVNNATKLGTDLIINQTNTTVVSAAAPFVTVDVNGANKTALRLNNPTGQVDAGQGQSIFTLISNTTGKNASFTVTSAEALRSDTINLNNPGTVYVDEDAFIPVEVFDKSGNAITSISSLNSADKGVKITINGTQVSNPFVLKDNVVQIKIAGTNTALSTTGLKPIIAMTATNQVKTMNLNVGAKAVPTVVRGLDADFAKARLTNAGTVNINHTNLAIEDQYGRVMGDAAVATWLLANAAREITVADEAGTTLTLGANKGIGSDNGTPAAVKNVAVTFATAKGSEKLSFTIKTENGVLISSTGETTLTVTDGTEYTSYSVDAIGTVYDELAAGKANDVAYDKVIKVYGVLANGAKVQLTAGTDYTVSAETNGVVNADIADGTLNVAAALGGYGDKTEIVVPVTVLINKNAQKLTQDVTFSKVAPKVASVKFVTGAVAPATPDLNGGEKTTLEVTAGSTFNVGSLVDGTVYSVVVTDQYGVKVAAAASTGTATFADGTVINIASLTVVPASGSITITGNGTTAAQVTDIQAYEEFNVEILYVGGAKATVLVRGV